MKAGRGSRIAGKYCAPSATYGDMALGFSAQSPEGWSSSLRANCQCAEDYDAFAGNAGVRFAW
ncbi:hypothetical protein [Taklimakanibacter lacteus]|uniref:hypothetical protein n=1 Tax=Taklimakanibacter lacteus TaxID=2268456 RepID=UPI000E65F2EE